MIKNSSDNMQHDNELFNDDVQLESLAASLSPFDNDLNPVLVTMDPSFEATNHDFRHNRAFAIDLLLFRCLRFSNKIQLSPQMIAEIPFWDISTKLPLVTINMYPVRPFSTRSLISTQDTTANNDEIICAKDNWTSSDHVCCKFLFRPAAVMSRLVTDDLLPPPPSFNPDDTLNIKIVAAE